MSRTDWCDRVCLQESGVPRAELVGVQVGDEEAARGRRLQDPGQRRGPVERPAGRLRRRPRVQDTQPHVLRPLNEANSPQTLPCLADFTRVKKMGVRSTIYVVKWLL